LRRHPPLRTPMKKIQGTHHWPSIRMAEREIG
jgi:hypothetical protein